MPVLKKSVANPRKKHNVVCQRPTAAFNAAVTLFADPNSTHSYYQAGIVKICRTLRHLGLVDSMTNLWTGADATMRHSHISGGRAFSHSHEVRSIASGSVYAKCGEFLGTLLVGAQPVMVVAHRGRSL